MGPSIAVIVVVCVAAAVVWKLWRGGLGDAKYVIIVGAAGAAGVTIKGQVPGKDAGDVAAFVAQLELPPGARVWAVPDGERLMLRFSADVPAHLQQRIRNYLYN